MIWVWVPVPDEPLLPVAPVLPPLPLLPVGVNNKLRIQALGPVAEAHHERAGETIVITNAIAAVFQILLSYLIVVSPIPRKPTY